MITLLPSEAEIVKAMLYKLELESILPPLRPSECTNTVKLEERKRKLKAFHSLCDKLLK